MPTYEYKCERCGYSVEVHHSMKDNPLVECPHCRSMTKRSITGGSGFILKSGGSKYFGYNVGSLCGKEQTCCGSTTSCETRPCDK
ncbi:MAG: zinc ribbon domain-containing protein [Nitrospirota bacterium]